MNGACQACCCACTIRYALPISDAVLTERVVHLRGLLLSWSRTLFLPSAGRAKAEQQSDMGMDQGGGHVVDVPPYQELEQFEGNCCGNR